MKQLIPWPRIIAEGTIIVVSILLAFFIDAWWDDRVDRRALVGHLASIEAELIANQEIAESAVKALDHRISLTNRLLLELSNKEDEISQSAFMLDLGEALTFGRSLKNRHNSIEALKNSNLFGSYENFEIINAINNLTGVVRQGETLEEQRAALYYMDIKPALERHVFMADLGWAEIRLRNEHAENQIEVTPRPDFVTDMVGMRSREMWNTIFGWKVMLEDYRNFLGRYKDANAELVGKVRAELERLR